jgi:hypothetical protein
MDHRPFWLAVVVLAPQVAITMGSMLTPDRYGPLPKDANRFKRRCRLLQSWYRVEILKIAQCGPWRPGGQVVGSSLVDGEVSGANFISPEAFAYAKQRVEDKKDNPDLTIEEFRLFNNMLSSMPMCFNLFADFRVAIQKRVAAARDVLASMFSSSPIHAIDEVVVEMIPRPTHLYIDDKTAWDAAIFYADPAGKPGLVSIETKYTDKLGGNKASKQDRKFELARQLEVFTPDGLSWHRDNGFDQVARNLLLTLAYADRHALAHAKNYVMAPKDDTEAPKAVSQLRARLAPRYRDCIETLPLETAVERGLKRADDALGSHLQRFRQRYLDFSQIAHL